MNIKISKIVIILILTSLITVLPSCDREERIPYIYVNFTIYLDLPEWSGLKTPGNYNYLTGGSRGIILYCAFTDEYKAYDRNCPYEPRHSESILDVDSTELFLVCRHCESKFMLLDGSVVNGPTKYPLLQYMTYLEGSSLYVYNAY